LFKDKKNQEGDGSTIEGGWVKEPVKGMNRWCVTYDFASLYPTVQRQFFISPENFVGLKSDVNPGFCTNGNKIDPNEHVVCVNNTVFRKKRSPTIKMLEDVYSDRKKNKKIMMDKKNELSKVLEEIKLLERELD
jgi:DNA polymerase elongation subunit (family B)